MVIKKVRAAKVNKLKGGCDMNNFQIKRKDEQLNLANIIERKKLGIETVDETKIYQQEFDKWDKENDEK